MPSELQYTIHDLNFMEDLYQWALKQNNEADKIRPFNEAYVCKDIVKMGIKRLAEDINFLSIYMYAYDLEKGEFI